MNNYIKDKNGIIIAANQLTYERCGCKTENEVIGKTDFDFFPKDMAEKYGKDDRRVMDTGTPIINMPELAPSKDGSIQCYITNKMPLFDTKGEIIGVHGASGSGKSTLIDIIIGLLEPQEGQVLVDNNDIKKNKKDWFEKIGYVPQAVYLNDDTIKNNIYFYEDKYINNLKKLKNSVKISQLKKIGLNRKVGERGIQISGGQKQRIGLARALYKEFDVLILDEATNALDTENEENFLKDVFKLKSKKTLILISHKKSIVDKCDKVITIKNKKIKQI